MRRQNLYSFEELIVVIVLRDLNASVRETAELTGRSRSSIRQKFQNLPRADSTSADVRLAPTRRFESIPDIYAAFGVPCPKTQEDLEQDMFERFKRWEERLMKGLVDDNRDR